MVTIEIDNKQYKLELDRKTYVQLLKDKEYAEIQNELFKVVSKEKDEKKQKEILESDLSNTIADELITCEKVFYYSLLKYQPEIDVEQASLLLDKAIDECGFDQVSEVVKILLSSFTAGANEKKVKKTLIVSK